MAAIQQQPAAANPAANVEEDPDFNWHSLCSPLEATFPLPNVGVVQRITANLYAKLQAGLITGSLHMKPASPWTSCLTG